jgi:hypothetical protein
LITGHAAAVPVPDSLNFALHLSRLEYSLKDAQQSIDITVKQIGVTSFDIGEQPLQPGLLLGYAYTSDSNQPLTAGMELQGFYIGPALRGVLIDSRHFTAALTGTYLYQRVKDSNADQSVTMEWQQPQLDLDLLWRVTQRVALSFGEQYGRIDVDEKFTGAVNHTVTLAAGASLGYRAGLEFDLGEDGQVGILLHRAVGDGAELYFQRQF